MFAGNDFYVIFNSVMESASGNLDRLRKQIRFLIEVGESNIYEIVLAKNR